MSNWFDKQLSSSDLSLLPETYENVNAFHRFLFIRCILRDRTISEARYYVQDSLGIKYLEIPVLSLELLWDESNSKISLLGLFSSSADSTSNIQTLTKKKNIDLFINAHLGLDYLEEFHEELISMDTFDPSFRVFVDNNENNHEFIRALLT
ncbi:unnamed protein product [Rotaria socialis]